MLPLLIQTLKKIYRAKKKHTICLGTDLSSKSKLIVFTNANDCDISVLFNNQMISSVSSDLHLGHIIDNQVSQECITNDLIKRVNILSAVFKFILVI